MEQHCSSIPSVAWCSSDKGKQVISSFLWHFPLLLSVTRDSKDNRGFFPGRTASTAVEGSERTREITDGPPSNALISHMLVY